MDPSLPDYEAPPIDLPELHALASKIKPSGTVCEIPLRTPSLRREIATGTLRMKHKRAAGN